MNRVALAIATWFGCGYWPWGPGTVGSLAALGIAIGVHEYVAATRLTLLVLIVVLLVPSVWAASRTARLVEREDPGLVVVDEVLGQWVTLLGVRVFVWQTWLAAFLLFRLLDTWKPWPIRRLEKLPEGIGIVADDLAAGIVGAFMLYIGGALKVY